MRIGYLVPEFPSQTHSFFWREAQALQRAGVHVNWLSTRRPPKDACRHDFAATAASATLYAIPPRPAALVDLLMHPRRTASAIGYVLSLPQTGWKAKFRLLAMLWPAADLARRARELHLEHIHVHSCGDAAHLAALARRLGGASYSLTLHGDLPVYGVDHRAKMRDAAFVSCVTRPLQAQVMAETGFPAERCPVIWMGVETARFRDSGVRRAREGHLDLLTVARLNPAKGHEFALRAVREIVDQGISVTYRIAGEGPARASIEAEVQRLALGDRVQLLGTRSESEVLELLQQSDALILPSVGLGEAAPVAVMEAMACGLPVICSIIGGTPDMINDSVDGYLVPQRDVATIAARLGGLANDLSLRSRIGEAARSAALARFDADVLAGELLSRIHDAK